MNKETKQTIIQKYGINDKDSGNTKVQIAILSARIANLSNHLTLNHGDKENKRRLINLVCKRNKLLKYLKNNKKEEYLALIQQLNLRK